MTRDDDLAALWSASAPIDDAELARLARRTPRRARLTQWGELVAVALLAVVIILAMVWNLAPATVLTGSIVLLLLAWSAWKRHHLTNLAMLLDDTDRLSFIRSLVRAKEAEIDRSAIGLALILPGTIITLLLFFSLRVPSGDQDLAAFLAGVLTTPRGIVSLGFLLCALLLLCLSHIRLLHELQRLRQLHEDYLEAERSDAFAQH